MSGQARAGWQLLGETLRPQRRGIAAGVTLGLAWTGIKVSVPLLVRAAIDRGIEPGDAGALWVWVAAIAVAGLVQALCTGLRRYNAFRVARTVEATLRDRMFAHLQRLHFAYHDRTATGQLMSRANTDLQHVQFFVVMIPLTVSNAVTVVAVVAILATIDPLLTLLAVGSLPLLNVLARRFAQRLGPEVMRIQQESAELATVVEETVSGIRAVKGFGAEAGQRRRFGVEADDVYHASMSATMVRLRYLPALDLLPNLGLVATLAYGGHEVLAGDMTVGSLVIFNMYVAMLIWPLRMLGMIIAGAQRAAVAAQRVHEVLSTDPAIVDRPHARALPPGGGEVRFEGVSFAYADGLPAVLERLDLSIPAGSSVALVGHTGCGKTTIARLLPRFYDVTAGRILLDGVDVRDLRLTELRRAIGIVFEDTFLFSDTVAANIAFADPDAPAAAIERAARLAGADEFVASLPRGYATMVGERGYSLSGGQRQRIAIARAVLADPRVLILDDATSSVDPTKEHEIRDALATAMRGRSTIVIAHRPATIAIADRVLLLDRGQVVAEGSHEELLERSEAYRTVLAAAAVLAGS